ncbi:hypothetical protein HELRODRAFT_169603 [Helobdella robusta]|uniref:Uncharacterized protein n=1 Tax=Helobdella robusta TaxID=6412 RepID=T1F257_HELRO|nr:hypothetical protein HELRODRAFT_169603 [Helobdella robusta]ESO07900.1 hypothetical protein HELRODRAFT_169603 [Helobdella robusta]
MATVLRGTDRPKAGSLSLGGLPPLPLTRPHSSASLVLPEISTKTNLSPHVYDESFMSIKLVPIRIHDDVPKYGREWGPTSYTSHVQMLHYFVVRSILDEFVNDLLYVVCKKSNRSANSGQRSSVEDSRNNNTATKGDLDINQKVERMFDDILNEVIVNEVTVHYKVSKFGQHKSHDLIVKNIINITLSEILRNTNKTIESLQRCSAYVKKIFLESLSKSSSGPFQHQQFLVYLTGEEHDVSDEEIFHFHFQDFNPKVLDYTCLIGCDQWLAPSTEQWKVLQNAQLDYWSNFEVFTKNQQVTQKCVGISALQVSPNMRFSAFSNLRGHVCVIDFNWIPPRLIRVHFSESHDPVISLSWTRDSKYLMSMTKMGVLNVWSLVGGVSLTNQKTGGGGSVKDDLVIVKGEDGYIPEMLVRLITMEAASGDFMLQTSR